MKNIRVVDLTSVLSGPFCTWLLGSLGADVIKVESPAGDLARATPPHVDDISLYFASLNRNKRSIVLDLKTEEGKDALRRLLETADVFVENMRPGVRDRLGFGDAELRQINPNLIIASISGFGQSGSLSARPAYDIVVQAMSGMMSINGPLGGPATRVGFSVGDISAALFATIGILQRLYERDAMGRDAQEPLDISMLACQWVCLENAFARYLNAGIVAGPIGSRHPSMTPFEPYPTADRDIVIGLGSSKDWPNFCQTIGRPDLADDPRFVGDEARLENRDVLDDILGGALPASAGFALAGCDDGCRHSLFGHRKCRKHRQQHHQRRVQRLLDRRRAGDERDAFRPQPDCRPRRRGNSSAGTRATHRRNSLRVRI